MSIRDTQFGLGRYRNPYDRATRPLTNGPFVAIGIISALAGASPWVALAFRSNATFLCALLSPFGLIASLVVASRGGGFLIVGLIGALVNGISCAALVWFFAVGGLC